MNPNLLFNRELDNYVEEDNFDFLPKAEAIKVFLEQNSTSLEKNKMLVLYGNWGSGKTSLMKYIEHDIDKIIYKPIFFHAWEHEKDENLALSLCDALISEIDRNNSVVREFMKDALIAFKSFVSGVTFKVPGFLTGLGLDFEFKGEKYVEHIEKALKEENPSFFRSKQDFKEKFLAIEQLILKEFEAQKIIVFVDDLDRCEPENVLNLITALKLFFTYGNNTIFFCGMDKEAVAKAVKNRYQDVIKSEEYLEKVFDISFNMPRIFSLQNLLAPHFGGKTLLINGHTIDNYIIVEDFLKSVRFTNPRHIKKVLNKYEILKSFKTSDDISQNLKSYIPDIIIDGTIGNVFETILCLFMIILHEFYPTDFEDLESYEEKMQKYIEPMYRSTKSLNSSLSQYHGVISHINNNLTIKNCREFSIESIMKNHPNTPDPHKFSKLILFFSHSHPSILTNFSDSDIHVYQNSFDDREFLTLFCKYLIKNRGDLTHHNSKYPLWNLFEMARYLF